MLRSNGKEGEPVVSEASEIDYSKAINSVLPPEIRVLGWKTAPPGFNARYPVTVEIF